MYEKLLKKRKENHVTLQELADYLEISKGNMWQIEHQKRLLKYDTAVKIAKYFDCEAKELFE